MNRKQFLAAPALGLAAAAALALAGCASTGSPSGPAAQHRAGSGGTHHRAPHAATPYGDPRAARPGATPSAADDPFQATSPAASADPDGITALMHAPDPAGPSATTALHYLQDLQSGRWLKAAGLLNGPARLSVAVHGAAYAAQLGADVLAHAGGNRLGACTSAQLYNNQVDIVSCGPVTVAVHHGRPDYLPGIWLGASHAKVDVLPFAHTHAYTTLPG
jgi:hypothetical protein